jgi:glyceraldehyde-3-phosphate dehydrogenase (NADP+)
VVNFVTGSGPITCNPIMQSGLVDMIGFIGSSKTADLLIRMFHMFDMFIFFFLMF